MLRRPDVWPYKVRMSPLSLLWGFSSSGHTPILDDRVGLPRLLWSQVKLERFVPVLHISPIALCSTKTCQREMKTGHVHLAKVPEIVAASKVIPELMESG